MRVLRVLTRPNVGGPTRQMIAFWHAHREMGVQTVLAVGRCGDGEEPVDLTAHGVPRLALEDLARGRGQAAGWLEVAELGRAPSPWRDALAARRLAACVRSLRPDVVHTHTSKAGLIGRRVARRHGVPVIAHTFHGMVLRDYYARPVSSLLRRVEARLARRTDLLFAVSPSCRDELCALGVVPASTEVTPPAIELGAFFAGDRDAARQHLGVVGSDPQLGFVGRLVPIKRPDRFASVVAAVAGAVGHVFGDGPLRGALHAAGERLRLHGNRGDLAACLPAMDALVLTSEREGCPLAAIEAFAAGVPVVGFDVPGVRDALATWGAGVLVPRADGIDGLVRAVQQLLTEPERRAALVERSRRELWRFQPAQVARQLVEAYRRALASAACNAPRAADAVPP